MRHVLALAPALLLACPAPEPNAPDTDPPETEEPVLEGTETVSTSWDVDLFTEYESPSIARFDTLDGRRKLDGMTITVDHTAVMDVYVENGSTFALLGEDYSFELNFLTIIQLGLVEDEDDSPPFFGPGSFLAVIEEDLAAEDGVEGSGDDYFATTVTDDVLFEAYYDRVETGPYLDALTGEDPLPLVVGGFSEAWVYWNDEHDGEALLYAAASGILYSGEMTVTYEFSPTGE